MAKITRLMNVVDARRRFWAQEIDDVNVMVIRMHRGTLPVHVVYIYYSGHILHAFLLKSYSDGYTWVWFQETPSGRLFPYHRPAG